MYPTKEEYLIQKEFEKKNFNIDDEAKDMDILLDLDQDAEIEDDISLLEDQINDELAEIED
jgi:hypothetical protein